MSSFRSRGSGKAKVWYARVRVPQADGTRKQLERGPFLRKRLAEDWAKAVEARVVSGEFVPGEFDRDPRPAAGTVADAVARYLAAATHLRGSSLTATEQRLRTHVIPASGASALT